MKNQAITLLLLIVASLIAVGMRPTKVYREAMTAAVEAHDQLDVCRARSTTERIKEANCFHEALDKFYWNATWAKQLGAIAMMTAMRRKAYAMFNHSATTVLDANGFLGEKMKDAPLKPVDMLKLYYAREKASAIELAKVWFEALEMEHRDEQARLIINEFLTDYNYPEDAADLYRGLGAPIDAAIVLRNVKLAKTASWTASLAEEFPFAIEQTALRHLSGILTVSEIGKIESVAEQRSRCGVALAVKDMYTVKEVVQHLCMCVAKWGELEKHMKDDGITKLRKSYMAIARNFVHLLSAIGADYVLRKVLAFDPELVKGTDNIGRTPLHHAASNGQINTMTLLMKHGASLKEKDAGGATPYQIACRVPWVRLRYEAIAPSADLKCGGVEPDDRFVDDEEDEADLSGGGWANAKVKTGAVKCSTFDSRSVESISHNEFVGRYLLSSIPVILRGIPTAMSKPMKKKNLIKVFGKVAVRTELFPAAENYGTPHEGNTTIEAFVKAAEPERVASIETPKTNPLDEVTKFFPFVAAPKDEGYTTVSRSIPMFIIANTGARSNHAFRDAHLLHTVVHGQQSVMLHPPAHAKTTRERAMFNVTDDAALRCELQPGDSLVVPSMWSFAWSSHVGQSVVVQRRFHWK